MTLLLVFLIVVVLLSVDWTTDPPTINYAGLLFGMLLAGVIALSRWFIAAGRVCATCGRPVFIPSNTVFCPYCSARLR